MIDSSKASSQGLFPPWFQLGMSAHSLNSALISMVVFVSSKVDDDYLLSVFFFAFLVNMIGVNVLEADMPSMI